MITNLYETIVYLLILTFSGDVLWNVVPLAIATILVLFYFERHKGEKPGWSSYLSNSLVLLFVSMALLRYIYGIADGGAANFIDYSGKSIASVILLLIGMIVLRFNFEHIMPERFTKFISSTITTNLVAYGIILYVYSDLKSDFYLFAGLIIIIVILGIIFQLAKMPLRKLFVIVEKEKKKERLKDAKEEGYQIEELKKEVKEREKVLKKVKLKSVKEDKNVASKIEKTLKKVVKK